MLIKKYATLLFSLLLIVTLFYAGLNLAEEGTNSLLGLEDSPQAFRVFSGEEGELVVYFAGNSRTFNVRFVGEGVASIKNGFQGIISNFLSSNDQ